MSRLRLSVFSVTRLKFNRFNVIRLLSNDRDKANHYDALEVNRGSSQSEIKEAYYKLSKQYHPDRNQGDDDASDKFRKITEAYDVLSNVDSKREYDTSLSMAEAASSPYASKYRPPPTFREINRTTGKPIDAEDYTQFYKNRQAQLGRSHYQPSNFGPKESEPGEEVLNPFSTYINPQPPPIKTKTYKYYSQSGWEDPGQSIASTWELKNDVTLPIALVSVMIALSVIFYVSEPQGSAKYTTPIKPSKSDSVN